MDRLPAGNVSMIVTLEPETVPDIPPSIRLEGNPGDPGSVLKPVTVPPSCVKRQTNVGPMLVVPLHVPVTLRGAVGAVLRPPHPTTHTARKANAAHFESIVTGNRRPPIAAL